MIPVATDAFVGGLIAGGYFTVGLFFLRFWSRTRDRLFAAFATAFWLMSLSQGASVLLGLPEEDRSGVYLLRLAAFGLIIAAVLAKNVRARRRGGDRGG